MQLVVFEVYATIVGASEGEYMVQTLRLGGIPLVVEPDADNPGAFILRTVGGAGGGGVASLSADVVEVASNRTPLVASGAFESPRFPIHNYATIEVSVRTDQNSASAGLTIEQFSSDDEELAPDPLRSESETVTASSPNQGITATVKGSWGLVRLVNGSTDQTTLDLMTLLKPVATTDFPSLGPQAEENSISVVPATNSVQEITQLDREEDSVTAYRPIASYVGMPVTAASTTLVAAPAAGTHLVVHALFVSRKETGTTGIDVGFRPGPGGDDVFRQHYVTAGQPWQTNLARDWALASVTALVVDLPGGILAAGGFFVSVAYSVEVDS